MIITPFAQSNAAILVEDGGKKVSSSSTSLKKIANNGGDFRKKRRAGIGSTLSGAYGVFGVHIDLNFSEDWTGSVGYGGSMDFQSIVVQARHYFTNNRFAPYFSAGYTRWSTTTQKNLNQLNPSYLSGTLLSDEQKKNLIFSENLLTSAIGVQFFQTNGQWAGYSFGLEVTLLMDPLDFVVAPTGGFNISYYF